MTKLQLLLDEQGKAHGLTISPSTPANQDPRNLMQDRITRGSHNYCSCAAGTAGCATGIGGRVGGGNLTPRRSQDRT
jgi:hypothetical protein